MYYLHHSYYVYTSCYLITQSCYACLLPCYRRVCHVKVCTCFTGSLYFLRLRSAPITTTTSRDLPRVIPAHALTLLLVTERALVFACYTCPFCITDLCFHKSVHSKATERTAIGPRELTDVIPSTHGELPYWQRLTQNRDGCECQRKKKRQERDSCEFQRKKGD